MRIPLVSLLLVGLALGPSCGPGEENELPEEFRQAIPTPEVVKVNVPGADDETSTAALVLGKADGAVKATWYLQTINTVRELNAMTWGLLHFVEDITEYPYTSEIDNGYLWGPFTPALSLVTIQFTLVKEKDNRFSYALAMRPKQDEAAEFKDVLSGTYAAQEGVVHGQGTMLLDFETASAMDQTIQAKGVLSFAYDSTGGIKDVVIVFDGFQDEHMEEPVDATYGYQESADLSGTFGFTLVGDVHKDEPDMAQYDKKENLSIHVQWQADGAGRADVRVTGGDLPDVPPGFEKWETTECWDSLFDQVYLVEQAFPLAGEPFSGQTAGEAGKCAIPIPAFR